MKVENKSKFLKKLREETKLSGLKNYPIEILEIGEELGLTEQESLEIAEELVKSGVAEYKALGNTMIQMK